MKYQSRHDLIDPDPDMPEPSEGLEFSEPDPDFEDSAYVIGSKADTVQVPTMLPSEKGPAKPKKWVKPAAFFLSVGFVALTIWNINHALKGPAPLPPPTQFQVKQALYLGVLKVDSYKRAHGILPQSAQDIDLPASYYEFHRLDPEHYVLSFHTETQKAEYDSRQSKESVFGSPKSILSMGDPK